MAIDDTFEPLVVSPEGFSFSVASSGSNPAHALPLLRAACSRSTTLRGVTGETGRLPPPTSSHCGLGTSDGLRARSAAGGLSAASPVGFGTPTALRTPLFWLTCAWSSWCCCRSNARVFNRWSTRIHSAIRSHLMFQSYLFTIVLEKSRILETYFENISVFITYAKCLMNLRYTS